MKNIPILVLTMCIALACGNKEEPTKAPSPSQDALQKETAAVPEKAPEPVFEGPGALLPKTVSDWKIKGVPRYFTSENLYDLINGGAEIYTEMGLKKMVTCDYASAAHKGVTVTVEIYDMGSALGAFGRVARFLNGQSDPATADKGLPETLKGKGILGETDVVYWKGAHLVHLTLMDESVTATMESIIKKGKEILPVFITATSETIKEDAPFPTELEKLPETDRIKGTEAWDPDNLARVKGLGPAFSARYKSGDAEWTLFFTDEISDAKQIETVLKNLTTEALGKAALAKQAGNRIVGYFAATEALDEKAGQLAADQVEKLLKSLGEK